MINWKNLPSTSWNWGMTFTWIFSLLVPAHIFAKAELTDQALILHFFDMECLEELIESKRIRISYVELKDRNLLAARTEELQKFITKFANDSTTFIEADTLMRQELTLWSADGKIYRLQLGEILLLEALGDNVRIHTGSAIITTHDTLKNLEKSLPDDLFMRVHRSYIIALDKIRFLEGNRLRVGEEDIPLGQSYRDHLLQYLQRKSKNGEG